MGKKLHLTVWFAVVLLLVELIPQLNKANPLPFQLLYQKNGASANDALGVSVAGTGDVNGDGRADFIVGVPGADTGVLLDVGSAYVYSGADGALLYQKSGAEANDQLGLSVVGNGDIGGDGRADFIVGAYLANPSGRANAGSAFIFSGADGQLLYQKDGSRSGDRLGGSVAGAGDVNADGRSDFIIGAERANPNNSIDAGSAFVYSGADSTLLYRKDGTSSGDELGFSVAGAGDVNGDGKDDFIIGAPFASPGGFILAGSAFVYSGATGGLLYQKNGAAGSELLGSSVAGAGDINADGRADFIVGAPGASPNGLGAAGSAYIYSGADGTLLFQKDGTAIGDNLGSYGTVSGAGDVNGDGRPDFIIGAYGADPSGRINAGSAFVFSGIDGLLLSQIDGDSAGDNLGSVAGAGDINGDGRTDVILGAPGSKPDGLTNAGSAYVYGLVSTDTPEEKGNRPSQFELSQNYPNPFNPTTTIRYYLPQREKVTLEIFNLLGERVKVLVDEEETAGERTAIWDGKDDNGKSLPSGIYLYRLKSEKFSETKKMIFLK